MRRVVSVGVIVAGIGALAVLGVSAQAPAGGRGAPRPIVKITDVTAHVPKAKVGGGACGTAGVLASDKGDLNTSTFFVECVHRQASALPYNPETHEMGQDEVFYVISGSATFVTGGKVVKKGKNKTGGDMSVIEGGATTQLAAGDVELVPSGVPHWFTAVPTEISYLLVRRKP